MVGVALPALMLSGSSHKEEGHGWTEMDEKSRTTAGIECNPRTDVLYLILQLGEVLLGHGPDLVQIEAEVFMHQDVPQRDDLWPRDLGMTVFEGLGDAAGGLSNHLQVVDHPHLEHLVSLKGMDAIRDPLSDSRDGLQDVAQAIRVAPHRAMASL